MMYYWRLGLIMTLLFCCGAGLAQEAAAPPPADAPPGPPPGDAPPPPPDADASAPEPATGDTIKLVDGKVMTNVQVVRATPSIVEVQIVPGVDPLQIPRKMVTDIIYDNLRPEDVTLGKNGAGADGPGGGQGEISLTLAKNLGKPVTEEELQIANQDVVAVLEDFAKKLEVGLEIMPEVRQMPEPRRLWNTTIPAGMAFTTLLREKLPKDFPQLEAVFTFEKVQLTRNPPKGAAPPPSDTPPPPAPLPAPPAAE